MDKIESLVTRRAERLCRRMSYSIDEATKLASMTYGLSYEEDHRSSSISSSSPTETICFYKNHKCLTALGIEFATFSPTQTGLDKSILDATQNVRTYFELENFHSYSKQGLGREYKIKTDAFFLHDNQIIESNISLYRPETKKGDPRMWFKELAKFTVAGDQIAIIIHDKAPYLLNLSKVELETSLTKENSYIKTFFSSLLKKQNSVADELLEKLKVLAKAPFASMRTGDTGLGFTLESKLGIEANSSKKPDYKGIEIKSGRGRKTRTTLFAQVPDWKVSPCKKSSEILNNYGYGRGDDFRLYCTVSTKKDNSQGLCFIYDETKDELQEWYNRRELVAVWPGELLRNRLKEKHAETFWVDATSEFIDGVEYFQLKQVIHTRSPLLSQFMTLIQNGVITMDHLIKRDTNGKVSEKGPFFKMNKSELELLFPEPVTYQLLNIEG